LGTTTTTYIRHYPVYKYVYTRVYTYLKFRFSEKLKYYHLLLYTIMDTEQLNFRINKELLIEIEDIARILKVSKTEWIKIKLAEIVLREHCRIAQNTENEYLLGRINEQQYEQTLGFKIPKELIKNKKKLRKIGKNTLQSLNKKIQKQN